EGVVPHPHWTVLVGPPFARAAAQTDETDDHAGNDEEAADRGRPDDHLAPRLRVLAQHSRIKPVWDGAEPVPEALVCIDVLNDLAGPAVDVDPAARRIVEHRFPQRLPAARALHGPLVDPQRFQFNDIARYAVTRRI